MAGGKRAYKQRKSDLSFVCYVLIDGQTVPVDQLTIIRIESNESFLYTLVKYNFIEVMERNEETGEYEKWSEKPDLDDLIEAEAEHFRKYGDQERVPFFKKLGE